MFHLFANQGSEEQKVWPGCSILRSQCLQGGFWNPPTKLLLKPAMPKLSARLTDSPSPKWPGKRRLVCKPHTIKLSVLKPIPFLGVVPGDYKDFKVNDPNVKVEEGTLSITDIQKSNEGYYLCEATNGIGSGLSAVMLISVQGNFSTELFCLWWYSWKNFSAPKLWNQAAQPD